MEWFNKLDFDKLNEGVEQFNEREHETHLPSSPQYVCHLDNEFFFREHHLSDIYDYMIAEGYSGGGIDAPHNERFENPRKNMVYEIFQARLWGLRRPELDEKAVDLLDARQYDSTIQPITDATQFNFALNNGVQFTPSEYTIPALPNKALTIILNREYGIEFDDKGVLKNASDFSLLVNGMAAQFHEFVQDSRLGYGYCIERDDYEKELIPVFRDILSGEDLVNDWRGKNPNWMGRRSGYYLTLIEACQRGNPESANLMWSEFAEPASTT